MLDPHPQMSIGEAVTSQRLRAVVRYWEMKRGSRPMPSRHEIDPIEIPRLLPIILLADATAPSAHIRVLGTEATSAYGQETAGKSVDELLFGDFTPVWRQAFARVIASGIPTSAGGAFRSGGERRGIETVLMPLSEDGVSISQIFGGLLIQPAPWTGAVAAKASLSQIDLACTG